MLLRSRVELKAFVDALRVPSSRREVILAELEDHAFEEMAEAESDGVPAAEAERLAFASLGTVERLRARFEEADGAFGLDCRSAILAGLRLSAAFLFMVAVAGTVEGFADYAGYLAWTWGASEPLAVAIVHGLAQSAWVAPLLALPFARPLRLLRALRGEVAPMARAALVGTASTVSLAGVFAMPWVHEASWSVGIWTWLASPELAVSALAAWSFLVALLAAAAFLATGRARAIA